MAPADIRSEVAQTEAETTLEDEVFDGALVQQKHRAMLPPFEGKMVQTLNAVHSLFGDRGPSVGAALLLLMALTARLWTTISAARRPTRQEQASPHSPFDESDADDTAQ